MKETIAKILGEATGLAPGNILALLEVPKNASHGDYSLPCFMLSKIYRKNPKDIALELAKKVKLTREIAKVYTLGPYLNFTLNKDLLTQQVVKQILKEKEKYGSSKSGKGKTAVIEFSSPNIAKPFGIGHLRSTIIGNSLAQLASFQGYKVRKINYLGDWGTQFGKLLLGYKKWGDKKKLKENPVKHLLNLYVKVSADKSLEEGARLEFQKLEKGDASALNLWKKFRKLSLDAFKQIYQQLGISFDVWSGESEYQKKELSKVMNLLKEKDLLKESEGALVVDLQSSGLGVCLIEKTDGTTLYATRDIAAAIDRYKKYSFDIMFYEVGAEQKLHFKQVFKILGTLGFAWASNCKHIEHGLYLDSDGKKFATRKGKTVFMEDILSETKELARKEILKREKLAEKELEKRASVIARAAIVFGDLKNYRVHDVVFDLDRFVLFEGDTGPYLLYTYARAQSILRKAKKSKADNQGSLSQVEQELITLLSQFPEIAEKAYKECAPNYIAHYAFNLAQSFNTFYHSEQVIGGKNEAFKLQLVKATSQVLKNALSLLGIPVLERM